MYWRRDILHNLVKIAIEFTRGRTIESNAYTTFNLLLIKLHIYNSSDFYDKATIMDPLCSFFNRIKRGISGLIN